MDFGWFLGGVLILEIVFGVPGIGSRPGTPSSGRTVP